MSSREQYKEYNKRLKQQKASDDQLIHNLSKRNYTLSLTVDGLKKKNTQLYRENTNLLKALHKIKRWWQIILIIKMK